MVYKEDELALGLDDILLLYTDGVTEAMDAGQQLYEETRLANLLAENRCDSTEELVRLTIDDVWLFQGEAEQADDVTLLALQFYGNPEGSVCRSL